LINASASGEDIDVLGRKVYNAFLYRVAPSGPINVNGINIFDTIELEYRSPEYT
jgi:adenylate cyclase